MCKSNGCYKIEKKILISQSVFLWLWEAGCHWVIKWGKGKYGPGFQKCNLDVFVFFFIVGAPDAKLSRVKVDGKPLGDALGIGVVQGAPESPGTLIASCLGFPFGCPGCLLFMTAEICKQVAPPIPALAAQVSVGWPSCDQRLKLVVLVNIICCPWDVCKHVWTSPYTCWTLPPQPYHCRGHLAPAVATGFLDPWTSGHWYCWLVRMVMGFLPCFYYTAATGSGFQMFTPNVNGAEFALLHSWQICCMFVDSFMDFSPRWSLAPSQEIVDFCGTICQKRCAWRCNYFQLTYRDLVDLILALLTDHSSKQAGWEAGGTPPVCGLGTFFV